MGRPNQILVAILLAVAVLVSAASQPASALTKAVAVAMMPCCADDCPDDPACNLACLSMVPGTTAPIGLAPPVSQTAIGRTTVAVLTVPDPPGILERSDPDGLKRPPRT